MNALLRAIFGDLEIAIFDTRRPTYDSSQIFNQLPHVTILTVLHKEISTNDS